MSPICLYREPLSQIHTKQSSPLHVQFYDYYFKLLITVRIQLELELAYEATESAE